MCNGSLMLSGQLQQVGTNGIETMMTAQPSIRIERTQQLESFGRAVYHGGGDSVIERHHGILRHSFQ
jgi:hypothetical protein